MNGTGFWFVIGATVVMFALWLAANIFVVARESSHEIVPLSSRPNWRARLDAAMLMLPVLAGVGAALLRN
jgi:heme/copper-type cytochrome/quinol oxidase subunit 3